MNGKQIIQYIFFATLYIHFYQRDFCWVYTVFCQQSWNRHGWNHITIVCDFLLILVLQNRLG